MRRVIAFSAVSLALTGAFSCYAFARGVSLASHEVLKQLESAARWGQWLFIGAIIVIALNEVRRWRSEHGVPGATMSKDSGQALVYVAIVSIPFLAITTAAALATGMFFSELADSNDRHARDLAKVAALVRAVQR